jgi:hypothetical protein
LVLVAVDEEHLLPVEDEELGKDHPLEEQEAENRQEFVEGHQENVLVSAQH